MPVKTHNELNKHIQHLANKTTQLKALLQAELAEQIRENHSSAAAAFSFLHFSTLANLRTSSPQPHASPEPSLPSLPSTRQTRTQAENELQLVPPLPLQTRQLKQDLQPTLSSPKKHGDAGAKSRANALAKPSGRNLRSRTSGRLTRLQRLAADEQARNEMPCVPTVTKRKKRSHKGQPVATKATRKISDKLVTPAKERPSTHSDKFFTPPERRSSQNWQPDNGEQAARDDYEKAQTGRDQPSPKGMGGAVAGVSLGAQESENDAANGENGGVVQKKRSSEDDTASGARPSKMPRVEASLMETRPDNERLMSSSGSLAKGDDGAGELQEAAGNAPSSSLSDRKNDPDVNTSRMENVRGSENGEEHWGSLPDGDKIDKPDNRQSGSSTEEPMNTDVTDDEEDDTKAFSEPDTQQTSDEETPVIRRQRFRKKPEADARLQNTDDMSQTDHGMRQNSSASASNDEFGEFKDSLPSSGTPSQRTEKVVEEPITGGPHADQQDATSEPVAKLDENATKTLTILQQLRKGPEKQTGDTVQESGLDGRGTGTNIMEGEKNTGLGNVAKADEMQASLGKQGKDSNVDNESAGEIFKAPKPVLRRRPPKPTATSLQTGINQTPQALHRNVSAANERPEPSANRSRFVVDEEGRVSKFGVLSQLASNPVEDDATLKGVPVESANSRGRLFKPTADIYSGKKRGMATTNTIQRSRLIRPTTILRTPGARTPLKTDGSKKSIVWQDLAENPRAHQLSGPLTHNLPVNDDQQPDSIQASVLETLGAGNEQDSASSPESNTHEFESALHTPSAKPFKETTRKLTFASSHAEDPSDSTVDAVSSPVGEARNKIAQLLETNRTQVGSNAPQTAPGPGPRSRIAGAQVKSALRCRIETLRAERSASRPLTADTGGPKSRLDSAALSNVENPASDRETLPSTQSSADIISALAASARKSLNARQQQSRVSFGSMIGSQPESDIFSTTKSSDPKESEVESGEIEHDDDNPKEPADPGVPKQTSETEAAEEDSSKGNDPSKGVGETNRARHVNVDGIVRAESAASLKQDENTSEGENRKSGTSHYSHSPATDRQELRSSADCEVESERENPFQEDEDTKQEGNAGMLSNLVSSVTSFLPVSFTARPEEKSEEEEAKAAAKKQRQDAERRAAEIFARREALRLAKQREGEEKQRKAEQRRRMMEEAEKHKAEEKKRKEEQRLKKRQEEEMRQRKEKQAEDRRREEHRQKVLEQKKQAEIARREAEAEMRRNPKEKAARGRPGLLNGDNTGKPKAYKGGTTTLSRLGPNGSSKIAKSGAVDKSAAGLKTPRTLRLLHQVDEVTSYELTAERPRNDSESSHDMRVRRRKKPIPTWAGKENVLGVLKEQNQDPDYVFSRVHTCNLDDVFKGDSRQYRPRGSSGNWTKDRLTAKEEVEFKRKHGYFENT